MVGVVRSKDSVWDMEIWSGVWVVGMEVERTYEYCWLKLLEED